MDNEHIQSDLFVSSNKSKIKSKLISFSLAMNDSNIKKKSYKNTSNFKFKTQKTSPEKTILNQEVKNIKNEPVKTNKNKINEIDNLEKDFFNVNEEYMKQKILKKKLESSNIKRANLLNYSNLFHNLSANNRHSNDLNLFNRTKKNKIKILPTNINYQKAILINNSINSPIVEDSKQKITSFSSISYLNHYIGANNNNSRPLTLTGSVIVHQNNKKSNNIDNKNLIRDIKNNINNNINKKEKNKNYNHKKELEDNKKKISITQPVTNKNSRRISNDKKAINNPLIQGKKNSILTNLTHNKNINSNLNSKNYLRNNKIDDFFTSQSVSNLKSNRNGQFQIKKNFLSSSSNNINIKTQNENSSSNSKKKSFSQKNKTIKTKKKNISSNNNHNNFRNENLLISKYLVKTSSSGIQKGNFSISSKDNLNLDINKKIFNSKPSSHGISKNISHKDSISHLKSNDEENKNLNIFPKRAKINTKKVLMINQNIFNSNNFPNKKTKSIFKEEEKKKKKLKNNFHSNPENLDKNKLKDFSLNIEIEEIEIKEKEKNELLQSGKYYKTLSENLSKYIKNYYKKYNYYPKTNLSFYKFGRLIGRGAFGKVNLGLHILTGKIVAIKSFNKDKLKDENSKLKIYHEINLMKSLHHNSIVKILETLETPNYILIIMENISGGDLLNFVKKRTKLNEKTAKFIFKQLITSIKYIHSKNIIHRDIKLDNILIDLNNNIKLCDFGVGKQYIKGDKLKDKCGTPAYIAPEILKNFGYEGPPVDIWSSGVVLYAMLSGTVPFKANQLSDLHKLILKGNYKKINGICSNAQDLIDKLLEVDPKKRIDIDGIFKHPWINDNHILDNKNCNEGNLNNNYDEGKIKLFTKAEIVLLSKENIDYRICEKNEILENFTLKNLYTINDEINKDICTKSVILAPFNSTIENNEEREKYILENNNNLCVRNDVFLFSENAKVLNRQYELNNNGEIDHGILINFNSSKNKEINNQNENNSNLEVENENKSEEFEKINNNNLEDKDFSKKDSKRNISSLTDSSTIDENILKSMENFGYKRDDIQKFLINNEFNYATAAYFLLSNSHDLS